MIEYRRVTDRHSAIQPASQPRRRSIYRAYYFARVKIKNAYVKYVLVASVESRFKRHCSFYYTLSTASAVSRVVHHIKDKKLS